MREYSAAGQTIFPQGLDRKGQQTFQLFHPILPNKKQHPDFTMLSTSH
ncbi:hypothetical protein COMA2_30199 [Candidatus Nitrospira nitrificans]|uniref:Uncharacterized protein n=1 Tax=Candidatus Nitrospira nitrificans TaxID=1742973 RepID=A0A0S4LK90_9BACT|nr:hypothetical protein COMA2_30199 [Candidatus Nitrospira nitrificans]